MKKTIFGAFLVSSILLLPIMLSVTTTASNITKIEENESTNTWYSGLIFIRGRYTSVNREFPPSSLLLLVTCNEKDISISGIDLEWVGRPPVSPQRIPFSQSNFSKVTIELFVGICRLGQIHGIAWAVMVWN
ncbi:MAG: hypothetical protein NT038_04450 [Euryarchaeota archaeon]|nr:hypothetical protein [Euryarchaeota archaeon]